MNTPTNRPNPLLIDKHDPVADPDAIRRAHLVLVRDRYRDIRDLRRKQTATEAVAGLDLDGREIFGLTKGQFSLIDLIEAACGKKAQRNLMPIQDGDVPATFADIDAIQRDLGFMPTTTIDQGVPRFVEWYKSYHGLN